MRREQLQHVILEISERFGLTEIYVIGSAAILATLPDPPEGVLVATRDVDVIPGADDEHVADRISYVMGEASDSTTRMATTRKASLLRRPNTLPRGWRSRAIPIQVGKCRALCMDRTTCCSRNSAPGARRTWSLPKPLFDLHRSSATGCSPAWLTWKPFRPCADSSRTGSGRYSNRTSLCAGMDGYTKVNEELV